jgi:hypothetical protein
MQNNKENRDGDGSILFRIPSALLAGTPLKLAIKDLNEKEPLV